MKHQQSRMMGKKATGLKRQGHWKKKQQLLHNFWMSNAKMSSCSVDICSKKLFRSFLQQPADDPYIKNNPKRHGTSVLTPYLKKYHHLCEKIKLGALCDPCLALLSCNCTDTPNELTSETCQKQMVFIINILYWSFLCPPVYQ